MEWISVKDKLPDFKQEVLFVTGKNEVSVGERIDDGDPWSSDDSIYFNDNIEQKWACCKYWMPLPRAPYDDRITPIIPSKLPFAMTDKILKSCMHEKDCKCLAESLQDRLDRLYNLSGVNKDLLGPS